MNFIIIKSLCSILEASLWTYFIVSLIKILSKDEQHFSKKQIILLTIIIYCCSIIGRITSNIFPFLNALITCPLVLVFTIIILKINWFKSFVIILANSIILMIIELISAFVCMGVFKVSSDVLVSNPLYFSVALLLQYTLFFALTKVLNLTIKNKQNFNYILTSINKKTIISVLIILSLCTFP